MPKVEHFIRFEDRAGKLREYQLQSLCGGGWRVTAPSGETYDLAVAGGRVVCTCPNYIHLQASTPAGRCKHGAALVQAHLIDPTRETHGQEPQDQDQRLDGRVPPDRPAARSKP